MRVIAAMAVVVDGQKATRSARLTSGTASKRLANHEYYLSLPMRTIERLF